MPHPQCPQVLADLISGLLSLGNFWASFSFHGLGFYTAGARVRRCEQEQTVIYSEFSAQPGRVIT